MPINHKFLNKDWNNGFQTMNAIMSVTPYEPEVLIVGTFNPNTHGNHNLAEFFYGRDNYLLPLLHGIFIINTIHQQQPPYDNIMWPLCNHLKLSFADLIYSVFPNDEVYLQPNSNKLIFNQSYYDLLKDKDLIKLKNDFNAIQWNYENIAIFINNTPSIKYVLLTQKSNKVFIDKFNTIKNLCNRNNISFRSIYTPTGQSLPGTPRDLFLAYQWLIQQDQNQNPHGFDINWLHEKNINHFEYNGYSLNF